jgi:hypothetical protein
MEIWLLKNTQNLRYTWPFNFKGCVGCTHRSFSHRKGRRSLSVFRNGTFRRKFSSDRVTIDGYWIDNRIYWTARDYTLQFTFTRQCPQSRLHCRCLVAASNGGCSLSSGFPNCPRRQIPASHSNISQQLNPNCYLTHQSVAANQFVLAPSPSRITTRIFFQLNPCGHSPNVTSSLTRGCVCLLWIRLTFVKCTYRTYSVLLEILPFALYTVLLSVQADCNSWLALFIKFLCGARRKHPSSVAVVICLFTQPLLSNGCCINVYFTVVA